ncbi:glycosyltransferase [Salisaeta longa]|uniref:glycosyltransferase n=1 Tax=Salisaeta longa TaxID=503170 RepID=UPI0003B6E9B6|nr:glycosyltransferase [Salisaeta longa]
MSTPLAVLAWPAFNNRTGNPYNRLLYDAMDPTAAVVDEFTPQRALTGTYDVVHVHWPDDFLSQPHVWTAAAYVGATLVLLTWMRMRGAALVWTAHDAGPHQSHHPRLERLFWRVFIPQVDGLISLSRAGLEATCAAHPRLRNVPGRVIPHGHYRSAYPAPLPVDEARAALDVPAGATVIGHVGRIRPYKNVPHLITCFRRLDAPDARLYVAGNPSSDALARRVEAAAAPDARVTTDLRFVPEAELVQVISASDLIALPYTDILHSGTALLALSLNRPVLVPARGAMAELQEQVGAAWVRTYDDGLTPAVLRDALHWAQTAARPPRAPLEALAWPRLAAAHVALYRTAAANNTSGRS